MTVASDIPQSPPRKDHNDDSCTHVSTGRIQRRSAKPVTRSRPSWDSSRATRSRNNGPILKGEFARTLNLTDINTGWVVGRTVHNNAHLYILAALKAGVKQCLCGTLGMGELGR